MSARSRGTSILVLAALLAAPALVLAPGAAPGADAAAAGPTGLSAWSVIDRVGVNVHMSYDDTSYADGARVGSLLTSLGVRHVRDVSVPNRPDQVSALQALARQGIRADLVVQGDADLSAPDASSLQQVRTLAPTTDSIETLNEYDCSGASDWPTRLRSYDAALRRAVSADSALAGLPVLGPSFCRPESVAAYGSVTDGADVVNLHDYAAGRPPELALESRVPLARAIAGPGLPLTLTETGYTNALQVAGGFSATEQDAADHTVRTLLDAARLGVSRTYLYELLDQKPDTGLTDPEQHYGLVRQDGTVKPAYTAVKNLLADLAGGDPNAVARPSGTADPTDDVTVIGGGALVRHLTVADPSGGGETVALWLATPVAQGGAAEQKVTVSLRVPSPRTATVRKPSRGNAVSSLGSGASTEISVLLDGAVSLVHLTPAAGTTRTACTNPGRWAAAAKSAGATVTSTLAPSAVAWQSATTASDGLPDSLPGGSRITAAGQTARLGVSGAPTSWTVALWAVLDAPSAGFATFAQAYRPDGSAVPGGLLRTYDLASDQPSHVQVSAYGAPGGSGGSATYGTEMFGQAQVGTWHLLALSVDASAGRATLSVDGVVAGTAPSGGVALGSLGVGAISSGFRGQLGSAAIFPSAVSTATLTRLATIDDRYCPGT